MDKVPTKKQLEDERLNLHKVINDYKRDTVLVDKELKKIDSILASELSDNDRTDFSRLKDGLVEQQKEKRAHQSDLNLLQSRIKEINQDLAKLRRKDRLSEWVPVRKS